jgi:flagellar biosynthetic protein FliP
MVKTNKIPVVPILICFVVTAAIIFLLIPGPVWAAPLQLPDINLQVGGTQDNPQDISAALQLVILLTILSLAPAILILLTSFTRIIVVLAFVRSSLATQQMPPNQVIVALALFLTFFVMSPVYNQIKTEALDPYMNQQITAQEAIDIAKEPIKEFMLKQTYKSDLNLFVDVSKQEDVSNVDSIPMSTVIPAFITS